MARVWDMAPRARAAPHLTPPLLLSTGALEYLWRLYGNGSWHHARAHESAACWELAFGKERLAKAVREHQV